MLNLLLIPHDRTGRLAEIVNVVGSRFLRKTVKINRHKNFLNKIRHHGTDINDNILDAYNTSPYLRSE